MTSATLVNAVPGWDEPAGIAPRGTLIVLTGRGEPPSIYGRFGRRLAADAYRVRVVETRLDDLDATRRDALRLLEDESLPAPKVLIGSDAGGAVAVALGEAAAAVVVAGVALGERAPGGWEEALDARTACPAHRGVLNEHAARGGLGEALPDALRIGGVPDVPTLVVHGAGDPVTPVATVREVFPEAELVTVVGGRHDILNDVSHRSVAATIVLFLERLRLGAPIVEPG